MIDSERQLKRAVQGFKPQGLDLDHAAGEIHRRAAEAQRPRQRRGRRVAAIAAIAAFTGAATFGGTQLVAATRDNPGVSADGTELGQVSIAELDPDTVWTVDVTEKGNETCIAAAAGPSSGFVCAEHWVDLDQHPQATFASAPDGPEGQHRMLAFVIASATRKVGLMPARPCHKISTSLSECAYPSPAPEPVDLSSTRGVHSSVVKLSGNPARIWSFVVEGNNPLPRIVYLD